MPLPSEAATQSDAASLSDEKPLKRRGALMKRHVHGTVHVKCMDCRPPSPAVAGEYARRRPCPREAARLRGVPLRQGRRSGGSPAAATRPPSPVALGPEYRPRARAAPGAASMPPRGEFSRRRPAGVAFGRGDEESGAASRGDGRSGRSTGPTSPTLFAYPTARPTGPSDFP